MSDPVSRSAAKLAALVAVPVGLLAGLGVFLLLANAPGAPSEPAPTTPPAATGPEATGPEASGPVELAARELTEWEATVCRALLSQLPDTVRELPQRPVTAGAEQNAAYGDPPITVECGVPPADYPPTDQVWPLDGVCYHATERDGATVWVTVDREVPVRVTLPDAYGGQWVADFSPTIVSTVLSSDDIPTGCR